MPDLDRLLRAELGELIERRSTLQENIVQEQADLAAIASRIGHIQALLAEAGHATEPTPTPVQSDGGESVESGADATALDPADAAFQLLLENGGEPSYYRDLANLIQEKGVILGGSNPAQTLVSVLVNDERFVRPFRRGWYALRLHYPKAQNVGARKPRAKKK